jgi:hypothetical protein
MNVLRVKNTGYSNVLDGYIKITNAVSNMSSITNMRNIAFEL